MEKNFKRMNGYLDTLRRSNYLSQESIQRKNLNQLFSEFEDTLIAQKNKFTDNFDDASVQAIFSMYSGLANQGWTFTEFDSLFSNEKEELLVKTLWEFYKKFLKLTNNDEEDLDSTNTFSSVYDKKQISTDWVLSKGVYLPSIGVIFDDKIKVTLTFMLSNGQIQTQSFRIDPDLLEDFIRNVKLSLKSAQNFEKELSG